MQNNRRNQRPEWKETKRFVSGQIAVVVSMAQAFRPKFSVQVGRLREDGVVSGHLPVQVDGGFIVKMTPIAKTVFTLLEQAEEWISTEMALRGNEEIDKRIEREQKQANFGKNETRVTGKTAKKKAKRLGQPSL